MDSLKEISGKDKGQAVTFVKEVYYHDATGFPVAGFMRCSRLNRRKRTNGKLQGDDGNNSSDTDTSDEKGTPKVRSNKKPTGHRYHISLDGYRDDNCPHGSIFEEYVCVIRPASSSSPFLNNLHLLSAASMVAHDSVANQSATSNGGDSQSDGSHSSGVPHSSLTTDQTKDSITNSSTGTNSSSGSNSSEDRSNHSEENNGSDDNDCQSRNSGSDT
jgi:hypothetical protein